MQYNTSLAHLEDVLPVQQMCHEPKPPSVPNKKKIFSAAIHTYSMLQEYSKVNGIGDSLLGNLTLLSYVAFFNLPA